MGQAIGTKIKRRQGIDVGVEKDLRIIMRDSLLSQVSAFLRKSMLAQVFRNPSVYKVAMAVRLEIIQRNDGYED